MVRKGVRRREIERNLIWQYHVPTCEKFSMATLFPFLISIEKSPRRKYQNSQRSQLRWRRHFIRSKVQRDVSTLHPDSIWSKCASLKIPREIYLNSFFIESFLAWKPRLSWHLMFQFSIEFMHSFHHPSAHWHEMLRVAVEIKSILMSSHQILSASCSRNLKLRSLLSALNLIWYARNDFLNLQSCA